MRNQGSKAARGGGARALAAAALVTGMALMAERGAPAAAAEAGQEQSLVYRLALPVIARDGLSPIGQNLFTTAAEASYAVGTVSIGVTVRAVQDDLVVVDVEVYDAHGERVYQGYFDREPLRARETRSFTLQWKPGPGVLPGTYRVKVGIFAPGPEWAALFHWNDEATTVTLP